MSDIPSGMNSEVESSSRVICQFKVQDVGLVDGKIVKHAIKDVAIVERGGQYTLEPANPQQFRKNIDLVGITSTGSPEKNVTLVTVKAADGEYVDHSGFNNMLNHTDDFIVDGKSYDYRDLIGGMSVGKSCYSESGVRNPTFVLPVRNRIHAIETDVLVFPESAGGTSTVLALGGKLIRAAVEHDEKREKKDKVGYGDELDKYIFELYGIKKPKKGQSLPVSREDFLRELMLGGKIQTPNGKKQETDLEIEHIQKICEKFWGRILKSPEYSLFVNERLEATKAIESKYLTGYQTQQTPPPEVSTPFREARRGEADKTQIEEIKFLNYEVPLKLGEIRRSFEYVPGEGHQEKKYTVNRSSKEVDGFQLVIYDDRSNEVFHCDQMAVEELEAVLIWQLPDEVRRLTQLQDSDRDKYIVGVFNRLNRNRLNNRNNLRGLNFIKGDKVTFVEAGRLKEFTIHTYKDDLVFLKGEDDSYLSASERDVLGFNPYYRSRSNWHFTNSIQYEILKDGGRVKFPGNQNDTSFLYNLALEQFMARASKFNGLVFEADRLKLTAQS